MQITHGRVTRSKPRSRRSRPISIMSHTRASPRRKCKQSWRKSSAKSLSAQSPETGLSSRNGTPCCRGEFRWEWDGRYSNRTLPSWLLGKYPLLNATRAKLVHFYYELCLMPGIDYLMIRGWANLIYKLLSPQPASRRLSTTDLQLPWQPLWRVLQKELWPKKRLQKAPCVTCPERPSCI